jgi:hypothetical protein
LGSQDGTCRGKFICNFLEEINSVQRVDLTELDNSSGKSVKFGKQMEPQLRKIYEHITGNVVKPIGFIFHQNENVGATPDGIVDRDQELQERIVIEIKCPYFREYDHIPPEYMAQIQMQMEVTDSKACDFICYFHKNKTVKIWRVFRSKIYWRWMSDLINKFVNAVKQDIPPSKTDIPTIGHEAEQLAASDYNFNALNTNLPRRIFPPKCFYQLYYREGNYSLDKVLAFEKDFTIEEPTTEPNQITTKYFEFILFSLFLMLLFIVVMSYPSSVSYY